eukprot:scaffold7994_cov122-Isochrysis_galbana.AAC.13
MQSRAGDRAARLLTGHAIKSGRSCSSSGCVGASISPADDSRAVCSGPGRQLHVVLDSLAVLGAPPGIISSHHDGVSTAKFGKARECCHVWCNTRCLRAPQLPAHMLRGRAIPNSLARGRRREGVSNHQREHFR